MIESQSMVRGPVLQSFRVPGAKSAAVIALIGALWLAAGAASAQSGAPYYPTGYTVQAQAPLVAPTVPPAAPAFTPRTTSIRGLWIPGLVGLPVAWVATWVHASLSLSAGSDAVSAAFIPIAGPWMVLAEQNVDVGYYVTTGIVQDLSLICLVLGLVIRVREPSARIALGEATLDLAAAPTTSGGAFAASVQF
jgi:hypothetical protein